MMPRPGIEPRGWVQSGVEIYHKRTRILAPASVVFGWHQRPEALTRLIPPWEKVTVERPPSSLGDGARAVLVMRNGPVKLRWVAEHHGFVDRGAEGGEFTDVQVSGLFRSWTHRHLVEADGPDACWLDDRIEYRLPLGWLGRVLGGGMTRRKLERMFEFRHRVTKEACEAEASAAG